AKHGVRYLFLGKSAAILLGFPDTTQDVHLFPNKSPANGKAIVTALRELVCELTDDQAADIVRGNDFVQVLSGPFHEDLISAACGIGPFDEAWSRDIDIVGFPVCNLDAVIASKRAANRAKDRESLPRLIAFRDFWRGPQGGKQNSAQLLRLITVLSEG